MYSTNKKTHCTPTMKLSTVELFKTLSADSDNLIQIEGETLARLQEVLLAIAEDIISVCEAEQILYNLSGGTCLGAVRHGGFIPWDDDMDLNILSSDFERFARAFQLKYSNKYSINTCRTEGYGGCGVKVRLNGTIFRGRDDIFNADCGIYIDLFLLESVPDNKILRALHGYTCMAMGLLLSCRNFYKNRRELLQLAGNNREARRVFKLKINIGRLLSPVSETRLAVWTQKIYSLCKRSDTRYVTIPTGRKHYFGEMQPREGMVNTALADFNGRRWQIPADADSYLKGLYGNYMWIPPVEQREKHIVLELKFPE